MSQVKIEIISSHVEKVPKSITPISSRFSNKSFTF
jgi:hypothetical protein